jgi:serine/threonine protein kinase
MQKRLVSSVRERFGMPLDPNPDPVTPSAAGPTPGSDTTVYGLPAPSPPSASTMRPDFRQPGDRPLDDYALVALLGRGGYGEVWKALGPGGFAVALKFADLGERTGATERRALEMMRAVRHAHLLPIFGAWERGDTLIVAMELADGTLMQRLREVVAAGGVGIPAAELHEYMRAAATGLDFLNEKQPGRPAIQHKDVKPQNLLLVGGVVKVADFGLAAVLERSVGAASAAMTPAYAAPEQFRGQVTRWSDQYALAVTYCQLRGGRLPFTGSPAALTLAHLESEPDLSMLPPEERPVVARALSKEPGRRWPDCRAFVAALVQPSVAPPRVMSPPLHRRWPRMSALPAWLLVLLLFVAGPLLLWNGTRQPDRQSAQRHQADPDEEVLNDGPDPFAKKRDKTDRPERIRKEQPRPSLRLLPVQDVTLEPGRTAQREVRVERTNCPGPLRVRPGELPEGVRIRTNPIPAGQDVVVIRIEAGPRATATTSTISLRVTADGDEVADGGGFQLTVTVNTAAEQRARTVVERLGGKLLTAPDRPGQPIIEVDLANTKVTDDDLPALAGLGALLRLNLSHTSVTDWGLPHLYDLEQLQILNLTQTKVTDDGCRLLRDKRKNLDIRR